MVSMSFDQVLRAADELTHEEQAALIAYLQAKSMTQTSGTTREHILAEFERRKASGAFDQVESLRGKFAHPALNLSFEDIQGILHDASTDWENEIDEFDIKD